MPLWSKRQAEEELPPFPVQLKNGVLTAELLDWYIAAASAVLSTSNVALSPQRPVTAIREALKLADELYPRTLGAHEPQTDLEPRSADSVR